MYLVFQRTFQKFQNKLTFVSFLKNAEKLKLFISISFWCNHSSTLIVVSSGADGRKKCNSDFQLELLQHIIVQQFDKAQ